jgi:trk system potassium uptake protein TrkH
MIKQLQDIRERINLFLFKIEDGVSVMFRTLTMAASAIAMIVFIIYYGFQNSPEKELIFLSIIKWSFFIYLMNYFVRMYYYKKFLKFIKEYAIETFLMGMFVLDNIFFWSTGRQLITEVITSFGIKNYEPIYNLILQAYILVFVWLDVVAYNELMLNIKIKPAILFILSFVGIILIGTLTLMLPEMTYAEGSMPFVDALFTAVSATCVTGLNVVDFAQYFTFKGHFVIMILIQIGGIGIVSFASFFALFLKSGVGIKHQTVLQDFLSTETLFNTRQLLRQIIVYTVIFELAGAWMIFMLWSPEIQFGSLGEKLFYSVFHAISAFNNAGFSLYSFGMMEGVLRNSYILHITIAMLIIMGGLGFPALRDLTEPSRLRERMEKPWKDWKTSTIVAVNASAILIVFGMILFYFLERDNVMSGLNPLEAVITSFFQSVTARTAGFNTVDIANLKVPTMIMFIFLMYIGASSGGTGGGIKTSTFFVLMLLAVGTIKGKKKIDFRRRTISFDIVNKAVTILLFSASYIILAVFALSITEAEMPILNLAFETVSAFGTVGLSTGITPYLSLFGKVVITLTMFIGRVGTLTLAFAVSSPSASTAYKYPNTHMMVG